MNDEIIEAVNAFLTIGEITAFNGELDDSKSDEERAEKLKRAEATITEIAGRKGLTIEQLAEKVIAIIKKFNES
jgi:hypothetical protein